jgi:uncharacterized coiled-coil protein SlyX
MTGPATDDTSTSDGDHRVPGPVTEQQPGEGEAVGGGPSSVHDLVVQIQGVAERLSRLTGLSGLVDALPRTSAFPSLPRPAALSTAQLKAVSSAVAAQRRSIQAMQAQLGAFDEQLTVMEQILDPLTEWVNAWADLERSVMGHSVVPGA